MKNLILRTLTGIGFVAVVVAGADYALYVESKGYDVISGPCNELNGLLKQYLAQAVARFK